MRYVNSGNHIAHLQTGSLCLARIELCHILALRQTVEAARHAVDELTGNTENSSVLHITVLDEVGDNRLCRIDRNRKSKALIARSGNFRGVDANDLTILVDECAAGVTGVNRRIGLKRKRNRSLRWSSARGRPGYRWP